MLLLVFFGQFRVLPYSSGLAILPLGPCRSFGSNICFIAYQLYNGASMAVGIGISNTILFRYLLLSSSITSRGVFFMISISYVLPIAVVILPFTTKWDFQSVQISTKIEHTFYNLSIYEPFPGFVDVSNFQFILATTLLGIGVYGCPLASFVLTQRTLQKIRRLENISQNTRRQFQILIHGLSVQTLLPILAYIPVFTCYMITQNFGVEILLSEHLIVGAASTPALFDPFISFYFIIPYRNAIIKIFQTKTVFVQQRLLPTSNELAILSLGPCTYLGPQFCFAGYHIYTANSLLAGLAISNTVLFRFLVLTWDSITVKKIKVMIASSYIMPLFVAILPFTSKWDFKSVQNVTRLQYPTYDLSIYEPFPGFSNVNSIQFVTATSMMAIGAYGIPCICFILTRRILTLIRLRRNMSEKTKTLSRTLITGFTFQTILPILAYTPLFTCYLLAQTTGLEIIISQHLMLVTASSPSFIDPIISFYFIIPYREAIKKILGKIDNKHTISVVSFSIQIIPFTATWNFESVRNITRLSYPFYDFSIYEPFPGFSNVNNIQFVSATSLIAVGAYGIPIFCFILTRRILTMIRLHQNMSEKTKNQARTLITGLTFQTILPVLAYVPIFTCYLLAQKTGLEIVISQHLILVTASSPSLIDPLISFYFIIPYREAIKEFIGKVHKPDRIFSVVSISSQV
ncbi:unnamed protein product [Caenorhabditis angaria]|uniref:G-protein coupled receptors family 1 profile domain-containing protein n=1 Tax=Caenorhabditis angaria TaxID=860376 RepID=A0A9P1MVQ9_9PELO|nr:unnamed protein product [Caenorhabditis angaria]